MSLVTLLIGCMIGSWCGVGVDPFSANGMGVRGTVKRNKFAGRKPSMHTAPSLHRSEVSGKEEQRLNIFLRVCGCEEYVSECECMNQIHQDVMMNE